MPIIGSNISYTGEWAYNNCLTDTDISFVQLILKKMFVAVDREHVNVTKKHSVAFALVSRDLKVTACFVIVIVYPGQLITTVFIDTRLCKTKHPRKRFKIFVSFVCY